VKNKWAINCVVCLVSLVAGLAGAPIALAAKRQLHPVIHQNAPAAVPGQYIIVLKIDKTQTGVAQRSLRSIEKTVKKLGGEILFTYTSPLVGFAAKMPPAALKAVQAMPEVGWIEADQYGSLAGAIEVESTAISCSPVGLDRIDQRLLPLDHQYTYSGSEQGVNVHVYVLDTGIYLPPPTSVDPHPVQHDLEPVFDDGRNLTNSNSTDYGDVDGHGTFMAGIIGGQLYGVAKGIRLHVVRIAVTHGPNALTAADIIGGVDWVTNHAQFPAVVNISAAVSSSVLLDMAITGSMRTGNITYVVAAGDTGGDACNTSPADIRTMMPTGPQPIVVGASATKSMTDTSGLRDWIVSVSTQSNTGKCVTLFAPGEHICAEFEGGPNAVDGTSPATAHVTGVAARYLQRHLSATAAEVWTAIHIADNVYLGPGNPDNTPGWDGLHSVTAPLAGTPNELLHWGQYDEGQIDVAPPEFSPTPGPNICPATISIIGTEGTTIYAIVWKPFPHAGPSPSNYAYRGASPLVIPLHESLLKRFEAVACNSNNVCGPATQAAYDCPDGPLHPE
jgi:Subtilase family